MQTSDTNDMDMPAGLTLGALKAKHPDLVAALYAEGVAIERARVSGAVARTPEGWLAQWNASAKLQEEYPTAGSYVATMKRKARQS